MKAHQVFKQTVRRQGWMFALLLCCVTSSFGQTGFLGGYGNPYFQADFIQELNSFNSGMVNPALLYRVNQIHAEAGIYRWGIGQALGYQQASVLFPIRLNQTIGLTVMGTGERVEKTEIAKDLSISIGGLANFTDMWFVGHYSLRTLPWLMLGTNVKFLYRDNFGQGNSFGTLDFGVYINPLDHYYWGDLGFSLNFQDVVQLQLIKGGVLDTAKIANAGGPPTTRARVGVRYALFNDKMIANVEAVFDNFFEYMMSDVYSAAKDAYNGGKVLDITPRYGLHWRYQFIPQLWVKAGWNNNNIPYIGLIANLMFPIQDMINYVELDVNLGFAAVEANRGFMLMTKASGDVGYTREQMESKRMYDRLIVAPMDAYNEAMRLYISGQYWLASYAFGKVLALYPNFHLNDKATWYMADCYYQVQLNTVGREVLKSALEEYTTSEQRGRYLYGLMRLDYREGRFDDALKNHAFITNLYAESDIRPEADYLAGEIFYARKNYNAAEQLFTKIQQGEIPYYYAQYTLAIVNLENKKTDLAIQNLNRIISDTSKNVSRVQLKDAAALKLGHIYFERGEQGDLRLAVDAYKRVPEGSSYGDEALLGRAWAWVKVNQPVVCIQTVDALIASHPESPFMPEAYLLKGYGLMLNKQYNVAVDALQKCVSLSQTTIFVTEESLRRKKQDFISYSQTFQPTEQNVKKNALRKPTNRTIEEREGLKVEFDKYSKESADVFNYALLTKSHARFFRRKEDILNDAEYAIAKASNMMKASGQQKIIEQQKQQDQNLEDEITRLKKQLGQ